MIISSLANYYGRLLENPASGVAKPGWCERQVKFMLELSPDGQLKSVIPCGDGKHGVSKIVPEQEKRSSGIKANFLCDTSSYLLGIDAKGKPERAIRCFEASKQLHEALLSGVDSPMAAAIVNYFNLWNPGQILDNPIPGFSEEILEGGNLTFCLEDGTTWKEACNEPSIKRVCDERAQNDEGQSEMVSLVTGRREPIARLHPAIKGVVGAQSMGASLVGFNCEAFESYGHAKEQGRNAPVDVKSTQAYTTALNYLLAHRGHRGRFGDTTVVFWSSSQTADQGNCSVLSLALGFSIFESKESESEATSNLKAALERLQAGKPVDIEGVSFGDEFYLLGLAPNAARLSVRFFLRDSFGEVMRHVADHYRITDVCHAAFDPPIATPYRLLDSLENPNAKDPVISSQLSAPLMRSILQGARYPEALFQNALLRVRATKTVKREHAAIIRAYLIRNARMEEKEITEIWADGTEKSIKGIILKKGNKETPVDLFKKDQYLYLIPINDNAEEVAADGAGGCTSGDIQIGFHYDIVSKTADSSDDNPKYAVSHLETAVSLPANHMKRGKFYTYTFTISLKEIKVSAAKVNDWGSVTGNFDVN